MTGDEVLELVGAGRVELAIERLHAEHAGELQRFVAARLHDAARAADTCQEIWAALEGSLPGYRGDASPRGWLFRIARNKTIDARRRDRRFETLESSAIDQGPLAGWMGLGSVQTPTRELYRRQRADVLAQVLAELPDEEWELLELRFVAGLKPAEIVEALELDARPNTVSQRLVRLVRKVRTRLLEYDAFASQRGGA